MTAEELVEIFRWLTGDYYRYSRSVYLEEYARQAIFNGTMEADALRLMESDDRYECEVGEEIWYGFIEKEDDNAH
jgi:hypothetical protein